MCFPNYSRSTCKFCVRKSVLCFDPISHQLELTCSSKPQKGMSMSVEQSFDVYTCRMLVYTLRFSSNARNDASNDASETDHRARLGV